MGRKCKVCASDRRKEIESDYSSKAFNRLSLREMAKKYGMSHMSIMRHFHGQHDQDTPAAPTTPPPGPSGGPTSGGPTSGGPGSPIRGVQLQDYNEIIECCEFEARRMGVNIYDWLRYEIKSASIGLKRTVMQDYHDSLTRDREEARREYDKRHGQGHEGM